MSIEQTLVSRSRIVRAIAELAIQNTGVLPVSVVSQKIVEDARELAELTASSLGYKTIEIIAVDHEKDLTSIRAGGDFSEEIIARMGVEHPCLVMVDATDASDAVIAELVALVDVSHSGMDALLFYTSGDVFDVARVVGRTTGRDATRFFL